MSGLVRFGIVKKNKFYVRKKTRTKNHEKIEIGAVGKHFKRGFYSLCSPKKTHFIFKNLDRSEYFKRVVFSAICFRILIF